MDKKIRQLTAEFSSSSDVSIQPDHVALQIEDSSDDESMSQNDTSESDVQMSTYDDDCQWKGKSLEELKQGFGSYGPHSLPNVVPSKSHTILIKLPIKHGEVPSPFPSDQQDKWDQYHVKMPFSSNSLYPVKENGESSLLPRWELINEALQHTITSSKQIERAIFSYNSRYNVKWDFEALHTFFNEILEEQEIESFFGTVFPQMVHLALQLPNLITGPLPLLRKGRAHALTLSQLQIASLLANAFLCTFPRRNTTKRGSEYANYPDINFNRLFQSANADSSSYIMEKFKCIFNYFRRVTSQVPTGVVTFARRVVPPGTFPQWSRSNKRLPDFCISSSGTIEDNGTGMLQVDFANKYVGGGVLSWGCVQEEIRFLMCPEMLVSRLFTEALEPNEALVIVGAEQYNAYSGYGHSFQWKGNHNDVTQRDRYGRRQTVVVAIDALMFTHSKEQFTVKAISRELNKAYAGFHDPHWATDPSRRNIPLPAVATGNWGCGAFRGDPSLKALIQLMAAAEANRPLAYFTFNNKKLRDQIYDVYKYLTDRHVSVGRLWHVLTQYCRELDTNGHSSLDLYQYLYQIVDSDATERSETPSNQPPTLSKKPTDTRLPPTRLDDNSSSLAEAGFSTEYLVNALVENLSDEDNQTTNSQTKDSECNSQEEINGTLNEDFDDKERKGRITWDYFTLKPSSSRHNSEETILDNSASSRNSAFSFLEAEERVGANTSVKKRISASNPEDASESKAEEVVKRPKWPKPANTKRKISDYFGIVQS